MSLCVDLNADLGEGAGHDEEILDLVSSANIACGFHAGDPLSFSLPSAQRMSAVWRSVRIRVFPIARILDAVK